MKARMKYYEKAAQAVQPLYQMGQYLAASTLSPQLKELIEFRVSQINGCAYCLDMHSKDLRASGETEQRIYMLSAWRETELYSPKERAALAWAEALTTLRDQEVPEAVFQEATAQFSEQELIDVTTAVLLINCHNRINIAFRSPAGHYVPGQHRQKKD